MVDPKQILFFVLVVTQVWASLLTSDSRPIRIGAYYVSQLTQDLPSLTTDPGHAILDLVQRFDVLIIQPGSEELDLSSLAQDISTKATKFAMDTIINKNDPTVQPFRGEVAQEDYFWRFQHAVVGQYIILTRPLVMKTKEVYGYSRLDSFTRPPLIARIEMAQVEFAVVGATTFSVAEIDELIEVVEEIWESGVDDVILLGNLNAACNGVTPEDVENTRLGSSARCQLIVN